MAVRALILSGEPAPNTLRTLFTRHGLENHLAGLAIRNLRRIHNARAILCADDNPVQKHVHRLRKIDINQRLRRRKFVDLAALLEPIKSRSA